MVPFTQCLLPTWPCKIIGCQESWLLALGALNSSRSHFAGKGKKASLQFTVLILHPQLWGRYSPQDTTMIPRAGEHFTYIYKLSLLPGASEDIHSAVERKSLLAWHQDWTLDKKQKGTALWPRLPGQVCTWHVPRELRVHAERRASLALNVLSESARHYKRHRAEFFDLGGMKSWVSLAGIQSTHESRYSKPVVKPQNRKGRAIWIVFFFIPQPFSSQSTAFLTAF